MEDVTSSVAGGAERPTVGVQFVHGIGVQPRGHALAEFGGPLVEWLADWYDGLHGEWIHRGNVSFQDLERWLADLPTMDPRRVDTLRSLLDRAPRKAPGAPAVNLAVVAEQISGTLAVAVRVTRASERESSGDEPAHAQLEWTRLGLGGTTSRSVWLLAESWWAGTFGPPSFGSLARWGLAVLPRTIGSHLGVRVQRAWQRPWAGCSSDSPHRWATVTYW